MVWREKSLPAFQVTAWSVLDVKGEGPEGLEDHGMEQLDEAVDDAMDEEVEVQPEPPWRHAPLPPPPRQEAAASVHPPPGPPPLPPPAAPPPAGPQGDTPLRPYAKHMIWSKRGAERASLVHAVAPTGPGTERCTWALEKGLSFSGFAAYGTFFQAA